MVRTMQRGLKAVLCDLGGVIVLYNEKQIVARINEICERPLTDPGVAPKIAALKGRFDCGEMTPLEFFRAANEILKFRVGFEGFVEVWSNNFWLNHEVVEVLKILREQYTLVLVSNTDVLHWEFIDRRFKIGRLFDHLVLSYEVGVLKPERGIYEVALRRAGIEGSEAVFVDDLEENLKAARELGIHVVQYRPGLNLKSEIEEIERRIMADRTTA